jgi:chromate transporter
MRRYSWTASSGSQVTPGPISITATFVGYMAHGWRGLLSPTDCYYLVSFTLLMLVEPTSSIQAEPVLPKGHYGILLSFVDLFWL